MKRLFVTLVILMTGFCATWAQKGEQSIGAKLSYGSEIENLGFGVHYRNNLTDHFRVEPSFDYFLKKDYVTSWDLNLNAHYLFELSNNMSIYPLIGLTYSHWGVDLGSIDFGDIKVDTSANEGRFGINLGGGIELPVSYNFSVGAELKYQIISDFDQWVVGVNCAYKF